MRRSALFALLALTPACATHQHVYELPFWAGAGAERDPRVISIDDFHLCDGKLAMARVTSMPTSGTGPLQAEFVVEFANQGVVVRQWPMPVNGIVVAVSADEIVVPLGAARPGAAAVAIGTSGSLRPVKVPDDKRMGRPIACPPIPVFDKSSFLRCFEYRDLASGSIRTLAFEGPCT